jgi:hypothetical protein
MARPKPLSDWKESLQQIQAWAWRDTLTRVMKLPLTPQNVTG